jgi:hypothetical protein
LFKIKNNPFKTHREVIKRKISPVVERRLNDMKKLGQAYVPSVDLLQKYIEFLHNDYTIDLDILTDYVIATLFAAVHSTSNFITNALHRKWVVFKYYIHVVRQSRLLAGPFLLI